MKAKTKTTATKEEAAPALGPKLRFPEFREEWEATTLGQLAKLVRGPFGGSLKKEIFVASGYAVYEQQHAIYSDFRSFRYHITAEKFHELRRFAVAANDIIMSCSGTMGKFAIIPDRAAPGVINQALLKLTPNGCCEVRFLKEVLELPSIQEKLLSQSAGGAIQNVVSVDQIKALPLRLPSADEQQKIAECLSSVDELMAAQARKVDALKTHKKGLMQQLFPREGETQPRLRFPEFQNAGEWEESPLSKFILSLDAGVSVNSGDSRPADKNELGVLKTSAITKGQFDPEENKVVLAKDEISRLREPVTGGTIIMCRKNTPALVGSNAYVEASHENLFLPDLLWAAKPREGVSMRFLAFILGSDKGRAALSKLATGSSASMSNITKPEVLAFSVMAPSPAEQQRIATCLSSLDALITAETQKHEALKTHKKGLMQQLFPTPEAHA